MNADVSEERRALCVLVLQASAVMFRYEGALGDD
jgi:hypothetical protein